MSPSRFGLCGPDCKYRSLYGDSQASLSNMAGQQAAALTRVARLRTGIVEGLKKTYPSEFTDAENRMHARMSSLDDEVLLAYLDGFLAMPPPRTAALHMPDGSDGVRGMEALRSALAAAGVSLPAGDDLELWSGAVTRWAAATPPPAVAVTPPEAPGQAPGVEVTSARLPSGGDEPDVPATPPEVEEDIFGLFDDSDTHPGWDADFAVDDDAPVSSDSALAALADQEPQAPEMSNAWAGLFDPVEEPPTEVAPPASDTDIMSWPDPDPSALAWAPPGGPSLADDTSSVEELPAAAPAVGREPSTVPAEDEPELPSRAAQEVPSPSPASPEVFTPPTEAGVEAPAGPAESGRRAPVSAVKPELFPPAPKAPRAKGGQRRQLRVSAEAPASVEDAKLAAQGAGAGSLSEDVHQQLLAAVCLPRPMFIADLTKVVESETVVAEWEQKCRAMGTAGPVRFITAKPRHRQLGALVLPHEKSLRQAATEFDGSRWAKIINESPLKGTRLYEAAVLLRRFGDQVVTFDVKDSLISMRVNHRGSLTGIVLCLDTNMDVESPARAAVADEIEALTGSRLALLAVLTIAAPGKALSELSEAIREEARERSWSLACPLIAARSWEFAADGGTSAVSVLG